MAVEKENISQQEKLAITHWMYNEAKKTKWVYIMHYNCENSHINYLNQSSNKDIIKKAVNV